MRCGSSARGRLGKLFGQGEQWPFVLFPPFEFEEGGGCRNGVSRGGFGKDMVVPGTVIGSR